MSVYAFCPRCGTEQSPPKWPLRCVRCDFRLYPPRHNGVAVILWTEDYRLVVIERGTEPIGGLAFVSGFLEEEEDWRVGGVRELFEETRIELAPERLQLVAVPRTVHGLLVVGQARIDRDELAEFKQTVEAVRYELLWPFEALMPGRLCFPAHVKALQELMYRKK